MPPSNNIQLAIFDKDCALRLCKCTLARSRRDQSLKLSQKLRLIRRNLLVATLAWLFMNTDPAYPQRVLASMLASRLIQNSLTRPSSTSFTSLMGGKHSDHGNYDHHHHGMNAAEAIALIHAMNSNRGSSNQVDLSPLLRNEVASSHATKHRESPMNNYLQRQQLSALDRQQSAVLPRQANPLNPLQAVVAALAAALAAVAVGAAPLAALLAAVAAALAALLLALVPAVPMVPVPQPSLVKKLVIKKTVLPFVIPIPYKKKEKEIVYIPKPVHYHHKEHHHHVEHKYKKHRKSDHVDDDLTMTMTPPSPPRVLDSHNLDHPDKIQTLLSEQDRIQSIIDELQESRSMNGAASTASVTTAAKPKVSLIFNST